MNRRNFWISASPMPHVVLVIFPSFAGPPLTLTVGVFALEEMAPTRDDTYYYADEGECVVLQVQNVLFRIHKFVLKRESSMFSDMFMIPQPSTSESDGLSDERPIILPDLEAETFRALCWVLYASPWDLRRKTFPGHADVNQLIGVADAAHRFGFESTQKWALEILEELFKDPTNEFLVACSDDAFGRLCGLYILVEQDSMLARTLKKWSRAIEDSAQTGLNHLDELKATEREVAGLEFAEGYHHHRHVRSFQVGIYYTLSLRVSHHWNGGYTGSFSDIALALGLNHTHATRMLVGHFNMTHYWLHLRRNPPTLDRIDPGCLPAAHDADCRPKWEAIWADLSQPWAEPLNLNPVQPMSNLTHIKSQISSFRYAPEELPFCVSKIPNAITAQAEKVKSELANFFLGAPV